MTVAPEFAQMPEAAKNQRERILDSRNHEAPDDQGIQGAHRKPNRNLLRFRVRGRIDENNQAALEIDQDQRGVFARDEKELGLMLIDSREVLL